MKLKIGKPMASPRKRRDTGKWLAYGTIAVHNDRERVSVDVEVHAGEFDTKEEAARNLHDKANLDFVRRWIHNGGAAQLHRKAEEI
jgi:hypothetical protein